MLEWPRPIIFRILLMKIYKPSSFCSTWVWLRFAHQSRDVYVWYYHVAPQLWPISLYPLYLMVGCIIWSPKYCHLHRFVAVRTNRIKTLYFHLWFTWYGFVYRRPRGPSSTIGAEGTLGNVDSFIDPYHVTGERQCRPDGVEARGPF